MAEDDLVTRITLVERTMISREALVDREEKLLSRFEELLKRDRQQASEERKHEFKMYGHETAEQLRTWSAKIHMERDEILERRDAERAREAAEADKKYDTNTITAQDMAGRQLDMGCLRWRPCCRSEARSRHRCRAAGDVAKTGWVFTWISTISPTGYVGFAMRQAHSCPRSG